MTTCRMYIITGTSNREEYIWIWIAYGESYNQAMQGIEDMLLTEGNPMTSFKKSVYPEAFQADPA